MGGHKARPYVDWPDEPVTSPWQGFHKARIVGRIAQRLPNFVDRLIQASVEVHEGISRPNRLLQILPRHHLARMPQQHRQDLKRLFLQLDLQPVLAQFASLEVEFESPEADDAVE
jgi:hypothetical protein